MILRPAWKLMNSHLPVFTEVQGYNQNLAQLRKMLQKDDSDREESDEEDDKRGYESDEDDLIEEPHGIKGMTLQLIELLTTLVQRPNVQEVVRQLLSPLLMNVASYMIVEHKDQREFMYDQHYFLHDKTQSVFKTRTIKNQCVDLFSSLIEIFGDQAITAILQCVQKLLGINEETKEDEVSEEVYSSTNANNVWKRQDVGMQLLGLFIEDIQMFCIRNPQVKIADLIDRVVKVEFKANKMGSYLKGRSLWCASTCSESLISPDEQTTQLKNFIVDLSIDTLKNESARSIKLVATRSLVRFTRKVSKENLEENAQKFGGILDKLLELLEGTNKEVIHLPIQAFQTFSMFNQATVATMAPKITPRLLDIFKAEHSEGNLGVELINLFKHWCEFEACREIFINSLIPFVMDIVEMYYNSTANEDNKDKQLTMCNVSESLSSSIDSSNEKSKNSEAMTDNKVINVVDSSILHLSLDFLCVLLKQTNKESDGFVKIVGVFPQLLNFVLKSEDMLLLLHGTTALKNFVFTGHEEILKIVQTETIINVAKKLLSPQTNE